MHHGPELWSKICVATWAERSQKIEKQSAKNLVHSVLGRGKGSLRLGWGTYISFVVLLVCRVGEGERTVGVVVARWRWGASMRTQNHCGAWNSLPRAHSALATELRGHLRL